MTRWWMLLWLIILLDFPKVFSQPERIRHPVDTVGFATQGWQMDSVMARIGREYRPQIERAFARNKVKKYLSWKVAICPHDDYAYAGWIYPLALENIKAPVVILIGVAHKARQFGIEDRLVFDSFTCWSAPYGPLRVSPLREKIVSQLPRDEYVIHDSLHAVEHSVEALLPFLQYYNRKVEIIPILVPYMSFDRMEGLSGSLALSISKVMADSALSWPGDLAIVISTDAVHYGCEDWGGADYAVYGCDSTGYMMAVRHEIEIIDSCLTGKITTARLRHFTGYTVQDTNHRTYRWTWCGRYSVPLGLLTAYHLQQVLREKPLSGILMRYATSIDHPVLPVTDLGMGVTAPANFRHWVGYASIGYR